MRIVPGETVCVRFSAPYARLSPSGFLASLTYGKRFGFRLNGEAEKAPQAGDAAAERAVR